MCEEELELNDLISEDNPYSEMNFEDDIDIWDDWGDWMLDEDLDYEWED